MRHVRNNSGFTLIEILITIALISILAGIGGIFLQRYLPIFKLREATRDVASALQNVRLTAIKSGSQCVMVFGATIDGEVVDYFSFIDTNRDNDFNGTDVRLNAQNLADYNYVFWGNDTGGGQGDAVADPVTTAVTFNSIDEMSAPGVIFNNRGMSLDGSGGFGAGTIQLENTLGRVRSVTVSATGNIRIVD